MNETKDWYKSKAVWGGIVAAVSGMLVMFGVGAVEGEEDSIVELIMQAVAIVGGIVAIVGRLVAKSRLAAPSGRTFKLLLLVLCAACVMAAAGGCSEVQVSPVYSALLGQTVGWSRSMATRAAAGELNAGEMVEALDINADLWERFDDARDGQSRE